MPPYAGSYLSRLQAFTVHAGADGRLACKRDSERLSSLREGPDPQRGVRRREPEDASPRCKSRRALFPHTKTVSNPTSSSVTVSSPAPQLCLCGGGGGGPLRLRLIFVC